MYVKNFSRKPLKNKSCFQLNIWGEKTYFWCASAHVFEPKLHIKN